jgi:hypothetical protein
MLILNQEVHSTFYAIELRRHTEVGLFETSLNYVWFDSRSCDKVSNTLRHLPRTLIHTLS